ncbi:uncharacterized protein LOC129593711 [Paramacrobiotus metropolitanus]|uniref:uncharacterized protein LOC129593711 n=1 Tax=Paramacrobiotus metropolitanus TaxID=2943436 RepID=UPI002445E175|nr:uncharacterized protein LOC129593711 [Paramacrobiotus metropolitanus]
MICDGFGVHVLGRDGRLRYGRVVDVADDGLFVDMLCSNRRREFWSIDKCFSSEFLSGDVLAKHYAANYNSTVSVVVLVPETPCGPWIWVPGEISCHGGGVQYAFYEEVLVRWHDVLTGLPRTDVVPIDRIRCLQEGKGRCAVQKVEYTALHPRMQLGTFTRHSVQLDGQLRSLSTTEAQTLIQRWNTGILWYACRGIRLVDTVGDRLDYLLISGCVISDPIETLCLLNVVKGLQDEWTWMVKMMIRDDYSGLPPELWREVFSQLDTDTVSQTRLRFVCSTWNLLHVEPADGFASALGSHSPGTPLCTMQTVSMRTFSPCIVGGAFQKSPSSHTPRGVGGWRGNDDDERLAEYERHVAVHGQASTRDPIGRAASDWLADFIPGQPRHRPLWKGKPVCAA